jgi:hypothetical protein
MTGVNAENNLPACQTLQITDKLQKTACLPEKFSNDRVTAENRLLA